MSKVYKEYIDRLCTNADNGDIISIKKLLDETNKWSDKIKEAKQNRDKDRG